MEVLDSYNRAKSALNKHLSNLSSCLHENDSEFEYTKEEEESLVSRVNDLIESCAIALKESQEYHREHNFSMNEASLQDAQKENKQLIIQSKKLLLEYRDRLKRRKLLEPTTQRNGSRTNVISEDGNAVNMFASLQRTHKVMSSELDRVGSVSKVLDEGRLSLQGSQMEFGNVTNEIKAVRKQLKLLEWQARKDRIWIAAGICILSMTIAHIIYQRSGLSVLF